MNKFKKIKIFFSIVPVLCLFFLLPFRAQPEKPTPDLILQWEVSHPTGEHQMSLVFTMDRVDLFTNTSLWQEQGTPPRLGHFTSPLDESWRIERDRINIYLSLLKDRPPVDAAHLLLKENFPEDVVALLQEVPHAPVIRLNGYEMREEDSYFPILEEVFSLVWENQWTCADCVIYKSRHRGIERQRIFKNGTIKKAVFSRRKLNCYSVGKKQMECTDTQGGPTGNGWGGFRISL